MANKKKNSNYVTNKSEQKKAAAAQKKKTAKIKKTTKSVAIGIAAVLVITALVFALLFAFGAFDYVPTATDHVTITLDGYSESIHVELYGNDAPETVERFLALVKGEYFNQKNLHTILDGLVYLGDENAESKAGNIVGEFSANGFNNKVSHLRGTLSMARGEDYDSAYGQFFIVSEDSRGLDGKYAAFGRITEGLDVIEQIIREKTVGEDGKIPAKDQVIITSISSHQAH